MINLKFPTNGGHPVKSINSTEEIHHGQRTTILHPRIQTRGTAVAEAARRLGLSANLLHLWKKTLQTSGDQAFPGQGVLPPLEEENRRLRAENKRLQMERDILKAFFAAEGVDLRLHRNPPQGVARDRDVPYSPGLDRRLLRLAGSPRQRRPAATRAVERPRFG